MITGSKAFHSLTAEDLMTREMVMVPHRCSLRQAAHLLGRARVSGAPVVDENSRCIGVLSTTDFMRWVDQEERAGKGGPREHACICSEWEIVCAETLPADEVQTYMTADPVTATPTTPITDLARMMLEAHIHRVIVVDSSHRPIGIVSSTDVLSAVAHGDHGGMR